jgi:hypothetical protein
MELKNLLKIKIKTMDEFMENSLIETIAQRWNPLTGDNFIDINRDQWTPNVLNNIQKLRIYPMIFNGIKVFNMVDLSLQAAAYDNIKPGNSLVMGC